MRKVLIAFLLLLGTAFGQSLSEGSVVGLQILPNPINNIFTYDFELCCGIPAGQGGFLGNGFDYVNVQFTAYFKYPQGKVGYLFTGNIVTWSEPQVIDQYCTVRSATLKDGTISYGSKQLGTGLVAEYSQLFCQQDGVYWLGPGGLTVH
ncbi:MAG: hypothetical protein ABSD76_02485 [Terriglobales bacterium]|jgi:hypothetical protein